MIDASVASGAILAVVLSVAGFTKLRAPEGLTNTLRDLIGLSPSNARMLARVVSCLELGAAMALVTGAPVALSGGLVVLLFVGFSLLTSYNALRSDPVPCNCFGPGDGKAHPIRGLVRLMLLGGVALVFLQAGTGDSGDITGFLPPGAVLAAVGLVLIAEWALLADEVFALFTAHAPRIVAPPAVVSYREVTLT